MSNFEGLNLFLRAAAYASKGTKSVAEKYTTYSSMVYRSPGSKRLKFLNLIFKLNPYLQK